MDENHLRRTGTYGWDQGRLISVTWGRVDRVEHELVGREVTLGLRQPLIPWFWYRSIVDYTTVGSDLSKKTEPKRSPTLTLCDNWNYEVTSRQNTEAITLNRQEKIRDGPDLESDTKVRRLI